MEGQAHPSDLPSSPVRLCIDGAPGIHVEVTREAARNPSVGMIQRLENQVRRLPEAVRRQEQGIEETRQEYRDAAAALRQPFKHEEALTDARRNVERINQQMIGRDQPQPALDPELEAMQKMRQAAFPSPPTPSRATGSGTTVPAARQGVAARSAGRAGEVDRT